MKILREYIQEILEQAGNDPKRMPLDIPIPEDLKAIHRQMKSAGMQLFLVGGAVRDALMNKVPKDYDVATDATPEAVIELLQQDPELKIDLTGKAFGVVRVKTPAGEEYEIATFRKDIGKGRRPDAVEFTTIEDDVKRRDLTINALFYDMDTGEVVDYVGGIDDIKDKVIRAVGDPATRFDEDKLRILRTVRFAGRTGSDLDPATRDAILSDNDLSEVSVERITDEFVKGIRSSQDPSYFLSMMEDLGLFNQVLPGLRVQTKGSGSKDPVVQIAALVADNPSDLVEKQLKKMKHTTADAGTIKILIDLLSLDKVSAVKLKKEFNRLRVDPSRVLEFANLADGISAKKAQAFVDFAQSPPAANPRDLMAKGLKGPDIGKAMASAESDAYAQLVGEVRRYVRELLKELNLGTGTGIDYTGFVLSPETSNALKKYAPKGWVEKSHHMTIISPPNQKRRLPSHWLDFEDMKSGQMRVVGIAQNDKVITGLVDLGGLPIPMKGPSFPHVTIAINPKVGGKAHMSNEFQVSDFEPIKPIPLFGKVEEIIR